MSSAKRAAGRQLNHDNWDDEDEAEEAGVFKQADESEMKSRVIKRAKRRGVVAVDDEATANKPALFTGFGGFGVATPKTASFSFNKKSEDQGTAAAKPPAATMFSGFGAKTTNGSTVIASPTKTQDKTEADKPSEKTEQEKQNSKYLGALKQLNESMVKWLSSCMEKNAYCYFTPVFNDYSKHLDSLKTRYNYSETTSDTQSPSTAASATASQQGAQTAVSQSPIKTTSSPAPTAAFSPAMFGFGSAREMIDHTAKVTPNLVSCFTPNSAKDKISESKPSESESSSPPGVKVSESPNKPTSALFSFSAQYAASKASTTSSTSAAPAFGGGFSFAAKPPTDSPAADKPAMSGSIFGNTAKAAPAVSSIFGAPSIGGSDNKPSTGSIFGQAGTTSLFGNASAKPFSFKADVAAAKSADSAAGSSGGAAAGGEDEEYVPPKAEVENKITEDDAVYTKRVKLFYEKEGKYVDKGIGNMFIKPLDSGKYGLLVRADTNLGNILLNIQLAESVPIKRMGKNNVSLVCIPNPPMEAKAKDSTSPTMLLMRVKTGEEADEICDKLNEYKK